MSSTEEVSRDTAPEGDDLLYVAWTIIANAGEGDWTREHPDWQDAAKRWRDQFHERIAKELQSEPSEDTTPDSPETQLEEAEAFLTWIIDDASEVTTGKNTLVFHYDRPTHRDVVRRWVLARRGELPDGQ